MSRVQSKVAAPICALCAALACSGLLGLPAQLANLTIWAIVAGFFPLPRWSLGQMLLAAAALRGAILVGDWSLSGDLYRYLWEGRVQLAGLNPFAYAPADPALAPLRDALWEKVQHKEVSAIYPPGAMALFRGLRALGGEVLAWRTLAAAADITTVALLAWVLKGRGLSTQAAVVWALHPLPALESAASGHLEALALPGLLGAVGLLDRGRPAAAAMVASAGALVKLLPAVVLLPALRRPSRGLLWGLVGGAGLTLVLCAPLLDAGPTLLRGFGRYYEAWTFNGSLFHGLSWLSSDPLRARRLGVALGAAWVLRALLRYTDPAAFFLQVAGALVLLSPVVHPWYVLWALAPALLLGVWPWRVLAATVFLAYAALQSLDNTGAWQEPAWVVLVEYPPFFLSLLWWTIRRSPWGTSRWGPVNDGWPSPSPT